MWYHMDFRLVGGVLKASCMCKLGKTLSGCVHLAFLRRYQREKFPDDETLASCSESRSVHGVCGKR